ncbi:MAG: type I restriction endonuclease [Myxococcota bacterium]
MSQGVVLRLLHALGWPSYDVDIVAPEYSLEGRRVDFALCHPPGKPLVFVEVKQVGQSEGNERQLFEYAFHKGVPLAILTDGQEWHFFLPGEQGDYGERRVYKLDLVQREVAEAAKRLERYLGYQAICDGSAIGAARADYRDVAQEREIRAALPEAWRNLVDEEDDLLIELVADRVESLCGYKPEPDLVAEFLAQQFARHEPVPRGGGPRPTPPTTAAPIRVSPAAGTSGFGFTIDGREVSCRNGRDVLVSVFEELTKRDGSFPDRFAALPKHGRSRRYLARDRDELYPGRPDLVANHSHRLSSGWWLGVNVSRKAVERIVQMACRVAGLRFGRDLKIRVGG